MRWAVLLFLLLSVPCMAAPELRIGIEPFFSPRLLIASFEPLRESLAAQQRRPVVLLTAPDYRQFFTHIHRHDYDLVVTSATGARYAQTREGFIPCLIARGHYVGLLITNRKIAGDLNGALKGARVALPDPLSLTALLGEAWLDDRGVQTHRQHHAYQNGAISAVLRGDADFAIVSRNVLGLLAASDRAALSVVAETGEAPNAVLLASGDLSEEERARYADLIGNFINNHGQDSSFANMLGITGVEAPAPYELTQVDRLTFELQRRLKAAM